MNSDGGVSCLNDDMVGKSKPAIGSVKVGYAVVYVAESSAAKLACWAEYGLPEPSGAVAIGNSSGDDEEGSGC